MVIWKEGRSYSLFLSYSIIPAISVQQLTILLRVLEIPGSHP